MGENAIAAMSGVGLLIGIAGLPRPPAWRWLLASALLTSTFVGTVVLTREQSADTYYTLPLTNLLLAAIFGACCAQTAFLLEPLWWPRGRRWVEVSLLSAGLLVDPLLLSWVRDSPAGHIQSRAPIVASLQVLFFAPVAMLQLGYMKDLQIREEAQRQAGRRSVNDLDFGKVVWCRLIGLGVPIVVLILSVIAELIAANGLDVVSASREWNLLPVGLAFGAALAVLVVVRCSPSRPPPGRTLDLPLPATLFTILSVASLPIVAYSTYRTPAFVGHAAIYAVIIAVGYGFAISHSVWFHAAGEHLTKLSPSALAVVLMCGLSSAMSIFWLLDCAIWAEGARPIHTRSAVSPTTLSILGSSVLVWMAGSILAKHRTVENQAGYTTEQNLAGDLVSYAGFAILLGVLPELAVGRLLYLPRDETILSLLVPGMLLAISAFKLGPVLYRTVHENLKKYEVTAHSPAVGHADAEVLQVSVVHYRRVEAHFRLQKWLAFLTMAAASCWILSVALAVRQRK